MYLHFCVKFDSILFKHVKPHKAIKLHMRDKTWIRNFHLGLSTRTLIAYEVIQILWIKNDRFMIENGKMISTHLLKKKIFLKNLI